jgi:hypothetical protein
VPASAGPPIRIQPLRRSSSSTAAIPPPAPPDARAAALAERLRARLGGSAGIARQVESRQRTAVGALQQRSASPIEVHLRAGVGTPNSGAR